MSTIPFARISWLVDRMHIGLSDDEVKADIHHRCTGWTEKQINIAIRYALRCHAANRNLYIRVTRGE